MGTTRHTGGGSGRAPVFTLPDWFSNNIPSWRAWLGGLRGAEGLRALEIGSCEGRSAIWLLDNVLGPTGSIVCVDPHEDMETRERFVQNVCAPPQYNAALRRRTSGGWLRTEEARTSRFDIIYIDGNHSAKNVLEDAVLAWPLLSTNGVMIFDDYPWVDPDQDAREQVWNCPRLAIDSWLAAYRHEYVRLPEPADAINPGWQVAVRKPENMW